MISNFDEKLLAVLERHESDFLSAYKTHMMKVEKELIFLKNKAKEQEKRLVEDERIIWLESQLQWFRDELSRMLQQTEKFDHEIEKLIVSTKVLTEEKKFYSDQIKAAKRQNKLLIVSLNKQQNEQHNQQEQQNELEGQIRETKKHIVTMPPSDYSPFDQTAVMIEQQEEQQNQIGEEKIDENKQLNDLRDRSIIASTQNPTEHNTSRFQVQQDSQQAIDIQNQSDPLDQTLLGQYIGELMESGREKEEIVDGIEEYYSSLNQKHEEEMQELQEQIEIAKAETRCLEAEEVVLPTTELDSLSNFFLECVFELRKSLRHQLLTLKTKPNNNQKTNMQNSLLKIYMSTVKTGSQDEIEQFSKYEKQKLVQLLVTNDELLNYMFDKIFRNKEQSQKPNGSNSKINSQRNFANTQINNDTSLYMDTKRLSGSFKQQQSPFAPSAQKYQTGGQMFGFQRSDPTIGNYPNVAQQRTQVQLKDRQKSMIVGEGRDSQDKSDPYYSASPLIAPQFKNEKGQSGILLSRIKESSFDNQMLSQIDTDLHQQQFLSQQNNTTVIEQNLTNEDLILPEINQRHIQAYSFIQDLTQVNTGKRSKSSYVDNKVEQRRRSLIMRMGKKPLMEIKNGKLLIIKKS